MVFTRAPGKNVRTLYDAAWNISKRLHEVDALPSDAAMGILTGLTKATNDDFTCHFKLMKDLSNQTIIDLGHHKSKNTFECIKTYLSQTLDLYVVHFVNSMWRVKAIHALPGNLTCWNCGKPSHNLRSCPEPCNQDRINKAQTSHCNNKKSGCQKPGGGRSNYSRDKFGKPHARGETVCHINDKPHAWCGTCGWTTMHSTKYHDEWSLNKSAFALKVKSTPWSSLISMPRKVDCPKPR